ncbi:MAG: TolC family protein, partial [Flavobacterium sp.]
MKTNKIVIILFLSLSISLGFAQEKKIMSLKDAIALVIINSNEVVLANTKVTTSKLELESIKNNQYPNVKVSGQYLRLTNANIVSHLGGSGGGLDVSQLMLGQANVSMPIFSGFKLKNSINASENLYKSQTFSASHTKEALALEVTELFASLYKSQE